MRAWTTSPPSNPDRPEIERRATVVLWMTLAAGLAVMVVAGVLALTL